jgi:hypothetical protein
MRRSVVASLSAVLLSIWLPAFAQDRAQRPMDTENKPDPGEVKQERSSREAAIRQDAEALAANRGISLGQAMKAVRAQDGIGDEIDKIRKEHSGRIAGIYFVYEPEYKMVVRLKGQAPVNRRLLKLADAEVPVEFETGANATIDELVDAYQRNLPAIRTLFPTLQGLGTDERTGEIMVIVQATGARLRRSAVRRMTCSSCWATPSASRSPSRASRISMCVVAAGSPPLAPSARRASQ